ncbi:hypothetical protein C8R45DRAFT_1104119 [Mycena sanguinolenta]|nr:hypothetical protein C8R45DRAFT_1104119 [Mycena sanguinolenta]
MVPSTLFQTASRWRPNVSLALSAHCRTMKPAGDSKRQRLLSSTSAKTPIVSRIFYEGAFFPIATLHANPRATAGREAIQFQDILGPANSDLKLAIVSRLLQINSNVQVFLVRAQARS